MKVLVLGRFSSLLGIILCSRLGYATAADVIELKGRVACELSRLVKCMLDVKSSSVEYGSTVYVNI